MNCITCGREYKEGEALLIVTQAYLENGTAQLLPDAVQWVPCTLTCSVQLMFKIQSEKEKALAEKEKKNGND